MNRIGVAITSALAAVTLVALGLSPASAQTTLCKGVTTAEVKKCDPVSGYSDEMSKSHWGMYKGHNCTNYGAYRLGKNGFAKPSYNLGNAETWTSRAKAHGIKVDAKPAVGSIGTWPGKNHLVYVEVVTSDYIVISEDNYPGYYKKGLFQKIRVRPGEKGYPKTFIHFRDQLTTVVPKITGTKQVGSTLTSTRGTWAPAGIKFTYKWLRDGVVIAGANATTYTLTPNDLAHKISIKISGAKSGYANKAATSVKTVAVARGTTSNSVAPAITGTARVGKTLTASSGTWSPSGTTFSYQWYAAGAAIAGATDKTFVPTKPQVNKTLTVRVTGTKPGYTTLTKPSKATAAVEVGELTNTKAPSISGSALVGKTLKAQAGTWSPTGVGFTYQWLRNGVPINGATAPTRVLNSYDRGKTITVTVTGAKGGYENLSATSNPTAVIRSQSTITVTAKPGKAKVTFVVSVKATGVVPTGQVVVRLGATTLKTLTLKNGKATVTLTGQKKGSHTYSFRYGGDPEVTAVYRAVKATIS